MSYYGQIVDVAAPTAVYDATHAELLRRSGGHVEGLIVHLSRATADGFQVLEVWTDRAAWERADRELIAPLLAELAASVTGPPFPPPRVAEFPVHGLIVPAADLAL